MQSFEPARLSEPFFLNTRTSDRLEGALRSAVRQNLVSMDNLHEAITACVTALRDEGMKCEAALLTVKACVRHLARKDQKSGAHNGEYSYLLMDQIARWCIADFYLHD